MKINRAIKFQVYFSSARKSDLEGKDGLWYRLAQAQGEVTEAANKAITAL